MKKLAPIFGLVVLSAPAYANGAMGLGFEIFDRTAWTVYVVVVTVAEAYFIGGWMRMRWYKALVISLVANFLTGIVGGLMGCCAPFFHYSLVGPNYDPNPLGHTLVLMVTSTAISGFFESFLWRWRRESGYLDRHVLWKCMKVHALLIPVGLVILLIPERPYPGLEGWTDFHRREQLGMTIRAMSTYVTYKERVPRARTVAELVDEIEPYLSDGQTKELALVSLHLPSYGRFSIRDRLDRPPVFNPYAVGRRVGTEDESMWYLRYPRSAIYFELYQGDFFRLTFDEKLLADSK